jgi:ATP-dependent helicase/nuclease subunit B
MAAVSSTLHAALAEGAVAVTPNRRLARVLHREFDLAQRAAGHSAWQTPTILPYPIWLETLWDQALPAVGGDAAALLLTPAQAAHLWRTVVEAEGMPLLDPQGAAALAAEAWALVHEWGAGGESWRSWRRAGEAGDDAAVFAQWAEAYRAALEGIGALDLAQLPNVLAADAQRVAARCGPTILAGFSEVTPQQERLCAALRAAGVPLRERDTLPSHPGAATRTVAASPRDEVAAALDWARVRILQSPGAQIGIVVEDLAARRDEVVTLAVERLCPGALIPGAAAAPAPFEVSLGVALASVPLVVAALDLITLAETQLAAGAAAALLRSPYLPAAEEAWPARAGIERTWLEGGRHEVTLGVAIAALATCSPGLAARWRDGQDERRRIGLASPREWVDRWRSWLLAAGWPGSRPLDSGEYQAREAWQHILGQFASLGAVSRRLGPAAAIEALRALASQTIFQAEGSAAPIQILGVLEGTGLTFDALWVAGLAAERWPPAPGPNPLLPIGWQRERSVPRASAQRELAYANLLTARFARAAPEVMFSSAASADDQALSPSALILGYPESAPAIPAATWLQALAHSATLEAIVDDRAPRLAEGSEAPGGSRIVATQSDCPFQAVARHRLGAQPWPLRWVGLSRAERGLLVHAALATFWQAIGDHAALCALPAAARAAQIDAAVQAAIAALPAPRWRMVPPVVRASEARRLAALLDAWLVLERERAPFVVRGVEVAQTLQLAGLTFRLRLDRVDTLLPQGLAILDYKTGRVERATQWFDPRPRASQLGLYTLAQRAAHPEATVRVVAYAQLRAGAVAVAGLAADATAWPGLATVAAAGPCRDWPELEAWWRAHLGALAAEIGRGHAAVTPRESPLPCRACGLYAVCRIQSVRHLQDSDADDA